MNVNTKVSTESYSNRSHRRDDNVSYVIGKSKKKKKRRTEKKMCCTIVIL